MSINVNISQALTKGIVALADSDDRYADAKVDAQLLLCHVLAKNSAYLMTWPERVLAPRQLEQYQDYIARRQAGEPVAYIVGERGFWSLNLTTNPSTLIPRADTECLVECAIELSPAKSGKMLDLGTGTGAIALAFASEKPDWQVHACDYNKEAVVLARSNVEQCKEQLNPARIEIVQSHWFDAYEQQHLASFDLIVSNPPYIDKNDVHLCEGDLRFEPHSALIAHQDGYGDIFTIVTAAKRFLNSPGWLMIEHGCEQGEKIRQFFQKQGFEQVQTKQDLALNERFTIGCWQ